MLAMPSLTDSDTLYDLGSRYRNTEMSFAEYCGSASQPRADRSWHGNVGAAKEYVVITVVSTMPRKLRSPLQGGSTRGRSGHASSKMLRMIVS